MPQGIFRFAGCYVISFYSIRAHSLGTFTRFVGGHGGVTQRPGHWAAGRLLPGYLPSYFNLPARHFIMRQLAF